MKEKKKRNQKKRMKQTNSVISDKSSSLVSPSALVLTVFFDLIRIFMLLLSIVDWQFSTQLIQFFKIRAPPCTSTPSAYKLYQLSDLPRFSISFHCVLQNCLPHIVPTSSSSPPSLPPSLSRRARGPYIAIFVLFHVETSIYNKLY